MSSSDTDLPAVLDPVFDTDLSVTALVWMGLIPLVLMGLQVLVALFGLLVGGGPIS